MNHGESDLDIARLLSETPLSRAEHHATITSTNDRARELAPELARDEAALIVADEQTAGRGRGANRWWTAPGSLACSLVFDPAMLGITRASFPLISLATALAIVESVRPLLAGQELGMHWPNDVFAAGRKLSGILVEVLPDGRHVIGVGLNVNHRAEETPEELRDRATSLGVLSDRAHSRTDLLVELLGALWPNFAQLATAPVEIARRANRCCLQHDRTLVIDTGRQHITGRCIGIADDGALLLDTETGPQKFYSGALVH
jgi:BirA family biotin operon repressor/biotin-[acetyl-CoA-carboxylase] ligase